mgnify:FL=1
METAKILMVSTFYPPYHLGGDAIHVKYLADELSKAGHEVHVIHSLDAYNLKKNEKKHENDADTEHIYRLKTELGAISAAGSYIIGKNRSADRLVEKVCSEIKPDWIHYHNISMLGCGVLNKGKSKKIYTCHDHWPFCQRNDYMKFGEQICDEQNCLKCSIKSHRPVRIISTNQIMSEIKRVNAIIAPSKYMQNMLSMFGTESVLIKNFVPRPTENVNSEGNSHFIYTGVLEKHKGLEILINAYLKSKSDAELHILGDGSLRENILKMSDKGIKYLGFLPRSKLIPEVASSLCMAAPSICGENSPLSCIEALSVGVPLVVSPNGGLPELAENCGIISEPNDDDFASALIQIYSNNELRGKMSHEV